MGHWVLQPQSLDNATSTNCTPQGGRQPRETQSKCISSNIDKLGLQTVVNNASAQLSALPEAKHEFRLASSPSEISSFVGVLPVHVPVRNQNESNGTTLPLTILIKPAFSQAPPYHPQSTLRVFLIRDLA